MKDLPDLPQTPAVLLNTTQGDELPKPKMRPALGIATTRREAEERKMQSMRLQQVFQDFHYIVSDASEPEEKRREAAQQLSMAFLTHFETVVWALRTAGGAARP